MPPLILSNLQNRYCYPILQMRKLRCGGLRSVITSDYGSRILNQFWWLQNPSTFHNNHAAQQKQDAKHSDNMKPSKPGPVAAQSRTYPHWCCWAQLGAWIPVVLTQEEPLAPGLPPTFLSQLSDNVQHGKGNQERRSRNQVSGVLKWPFS